MNPDVQKELFAGFASLLLCIAFIGAAVLTSNTPSLQTETDAVATSNTPTNSDNPVVRVTDPRVPAAPINPKT